MKEGAVHMDTPDGRVPVPAAVHRLHGADRSGLGEKGWAELPDDLVGHPDDTNIDPVFFQPISGSGEEADHGHA
jgi:hypothetical protein